MQIGAVACFFTNGTHATFYKHLSTDGAVAYPHKRSNSDGATTSFSMHFRVQSLCTPVCMLLRVRPAASLFLRPGRTFTTNPGTPASLYIEWQESLKLIIAVLYRTISQYLLRSLHANNIPFDSSWADKCAKITPDNQSRVDIAYESTKVGNFQLVIVYTN